MPNLYAASTDVLATLGADILDDLAKDSDSVGATDHTNALIEQASRLLDSYIGARYVVPVTAAAALSTLLPHAVNLTRWMLLARRLPGRFDMDAARWLYEQSLTWAKDVRDGKADIPGATTIGDSASTSAGTTSWTANTVMYPVGYSRGF